MRTHRAEDVVELADLPARACVHPSCAMPPSRSQNGQSTKQKQQKRLINVVQKLVALSEVNTVKGFADALNWASNLTTCIYSIVKGPKRDIFGESNGRKLLKLIYYALSNGLKQLHISWPHTTQQGADHQYPPTFLTGLSTVQHLFQSLFPCKGPELYEDYGEAAEVDIAIEAGK